MTRSPDRLPATRTALEALAEAALEVIDELGAGELLAAVTPERLGARSGHAASSVRYQLSRVDRTPSPRRDAATPRSVAGDPPRKRWAFDREHVLLIALGAHHARRRTAVEASVTRYLEALTALRQTGDTSALAQAMQADLDLSTPGATAEATALTSERVHTIAVAAADGSIDVARQLRRHQDEQLRMYLPVYERALGLSGRVLRDGVSLLDLALQVSFLLEGVAQRRRYVPSANETHVLTSAMTIFHALTRPADGHEDIEPAAAITHAIVGPGTSRRRP